MSKISKTDDRDPFATGGWNDENATGAAANRAGASGPAGVGMAAQPGAVPAADPPERNEAMPDGSSVASKPSIMAQQQHDPVLAILPRLAEAGALAKQGDDDASDRFVDLEIELAKATATTLPGLRAHLQTFGRSVKDFDQGRSGGAGHVAAAHASAIEKALADDTAARLSCLQQHLVRIGELIEGFVDDGTCRTWYDNIVAAVENLVGGPTAVVGAAELEDHPDQPFVELFRAWQVAYEAAAHNPGPDGEDDGNINSEAMDRAEQLEREMQERPASGPIGMAIKLYMLVLATWGDGFKIDIGDYAPSGRLAEDPAWTKSLFGDAVRFCPEIQSLLRPIVDAPWYLPGDPCVVIGQRIAAATARGDEASSECKRIGAEGKSDAASKAARAASDRATSEILDLRGALGEVTATSLEGIKVQLETLELEAEDADAGFLIALCRNSIAGIEAMLSGAASPPARGEIWNTPPSSLDSLLGQARLIQAATAEAIDQQGEPLVHEDNSQACIAARVVEGIVALHESGWT
jgi:hypothetical protein